VALAHVAGQIQKFLDAEGANERIKGERKLLATALEDVQTMAATLTGHLMGAQEQPTELYKVGLGSVRFLMAVGDLFIGW
ncbi:acyl-CoA dehydrogenase C-terminal domain-containing protein, partial [Nocardia sp. AG03]